MRAAVYRGVRSVVLEETTEPAAGPRDVVVAVDACGLCGSDLRWYEIGGPAPGTVMGHEYSGTVVGVGADVRGIVEGDRIAVNPLAGCGSCARCEEGAVNLCAAPTASSGGLADRLVVRDAAPSRIFVLPEHVPTEAAAILEPLACAVRAVRICGPRRDEAAVVLGLGTIGQCVSQVLQAERVEFVVGVDIAPVRLSMALALGASAVIDGRSGDVTEQLRDLVGSGHSGTHALSWAAVGSVFECSGAPSMLPVALDGMVRSGGTVVLVGLFATLPVPDVNLIVRKELRVAGSLAYDELDFRRAFELLESGRVDLGRLVTHRLPLARIEEAYALAARRDETVKVLVVP